MLYQHMNSITELEVIDRETRKLIQKHHSMHASSDITRLYLPRRNGGRGLINITIHYKNASHWQLTRGDKSIHARASRYCNELDLNFEEIRMVTKQQGKASIKTSKLTNTDPE